VSAKNDFIHGDRSLDRIARARCMSRTALVVRAKKEGWVPTRRYQATEDRAEAAAAR